MVKLPNSFTSCCFSDTSCEMYNYEQDGSDIYEDKLKETFENSLDYRPVCKNFDYDTIYKTWIYEGTEKDKTVGYKYLRSYPYDSIMFNTGDFVHWDYEHLNGKNTKGTKFRDEWETWIFESFDKQELTSAIGRIILCNQLLKWKYNSDILEIPCALLDVMKYTTWEYGTKGVIIEGADIVAITQYNDTTKTIEVNQRFVLNHKVFTVVQVNDYLHSNYMEIYLTKTPELNSDDLENNIATNKPEEVKENGMFITPNIHDLLLNETLDIEVYNYLNGEAQIDGFDIHVSGIPNYDNYIQIVKHSDNSFSITNIKEYSKSRVKLTIVNNITQELRVYNIWLNGEW